MGNSAKRIWNYTGHIHSELASGRIWVFWFHLHLICQLLNFWLIVWHTLSRSRDKNDKTYCYVNSIRTEEIETKEVGYNSSVLILDKLHISFREGFWKIWWRQSISQRRYAIIRQFNTWQATYFISGRLRGKKLVVAEYQTIFQA